MKSTSPAGPTSLQAELVDQLLGLFEQAADRSGGDDAFIDVAGRPVRLRFAGTEMRDRLLPALAHLKTEPAQPALTAHVWDSASTATPAPVRPWSDDDFRERGVIRGYYGDGFYTVYEWHTKSLNVVDSAGGQAFVWMRDSDDVTLHHSGAPLRIPLNLWLQGEETQLLHSAAVGTPDGCLLLVGPSGAGKSSTALACLGALGLIGEDYCLVTRGDPPTVASIYGSAKLSVGSLDRLPDLRGIRTRMPPPADGEGKALLDLAGSAPNGLLRSAPLAGIAVLRIDPGRAETTVAESTAGAILASAGPSTMLQLPGNDEGTWRWLTDLVKSVPCYRLELGSDPSLVAPAIERTLRER